jgi:hypothetical protein
MYVIPKLLMALEQPDFRRPKELHVLTDTNCSIVRCACREGAGSRASTRGTTRMRSPVSAQWSQCVLRIILPTSSAGAYAYTKKAARATRCRPTTSWKPSSTSMFVPRGSPVRTKAPSSPLCARSHRTGQRRRQNLAAIEGRKSVAESRPRSQIPKRHRGHRNAGSPRRLIEPRHPHSSRDQHLEALRAARLGPQDRRLKADALGTLARRREGSQRRLAPDFYLDASIDAT